jgi:hypothetical protein
MCLACGMQGVAKGATEMKSLTKSIRPKVVANDVPVQLLLPVAGVLQDVQSTLFGLCVNER